MKAFGILLIIVGIICGLLGARSYWQDNTYKKASIAVKASVVSVEVKPMSGKAVASIKMVLSYLRDGVADSTAHNFSMAYTNKNPLPAVQELQASLLYVHYVPRVKRSETSYPNRVVVSGNGVYDGFYNRALFGQMFTFVLLGFMVRKFGKK